MNDSLTAQIANLVRGVVGAVAVLAVVAILINAALGGGLELRPWVTHPMLVLSLMLYAGCSLCFRAFGQHINRE